MNQLSDLELVSQAMSTPPSTQPQTNSNTRNPTESTPKTQNSLAEQPISNPTSQNELPDLQPLNLDPSTITSLSSLMSLSDTDLENLGDSQIEEIMKQLEMADGVADDLEGKLDKLLETLGGVEKDIVNEGEGEQLKGDSDGK